MRAALAGSPTQRRALGATGDPGDRDPPPSQAEKPNGPAKAARDTRARPLGLPAHLKCHKGPRAGRIGTGDAHPTRHAFFLPSIRSGLLRPSPGREAPGLPHAAQLPRQDSPAAEGRGGGPPAAPQRSSSMGWLPLSLEGFLRPRRKAHCHSAARGAGLADGPERERHARDEGVARVRGQRGVGGGVGRHGPVAQRGRVDVRVEAWGERRVGRLLHRARDHQLEQAANTRTRVRCAAAGRARPLVDVLRPGRTEGLDRRWPRASARRGTSCRSRACTFPGMEICEHALHGGGLWLGNSGRRTDLEVAGLRR